MAEGDGWTQALDPTTGLAGAALHTDCWLAHCCCGWHAGKLLLRIFAAQISPAAAAGQWRED